METREQELRKLVVDLGVSKRVFISPARDIRDILSILDIYVISSLWEGQPIAMLEAMAAGLPVVATKVGGVPEIIVEGQNGLLAEAEDVDNLAEKIKRLIEDEALRNRLSLAAREKSEEYGLSVYIKKLEDYFINEYKLKSWHEK